MLYVENARLFSNGYLNSQHSPRCCLTHETEATQALEAHPPIRSLVVELEPEMAYTVRGVCRTAGTRSSRSDRTSVSLRGVPGAARPCPTVRCASAWRAVRVRGPSLAARDGDDGFGTTVSG